MSNNNLRKRDKKLGPMQRALNDYLAATGNLSKGVAMLCIELWPQIVGPWYSRKTQVIRVSDKELQILCDSAATAQQLQLDKTQIIKRLNERLDGNVIKDLRASTAGRWKNNPLLPVNPPDHPHLTDEDLESVELTPEEEDFCENAASAIEDDEIRERFLQSVSAEMKRRRLKIQRGHRECPICGGLFAGMDEYCPVCRANISDGSAQ